MNNFLVDVWTVLSKELAELLSARRREPVWLATSFAVLILLGILLPLLAGPNSLEQAWLLALWAWAPVFLVSNIVCDLVAGERENHTLETLLASRLQERAILLGKVGAAVIFGWGLVLAAVLLSLVTVNIAFAGDTLLLYRPLMAVGGGVLSFLAALLAASAGVLVSLHSHSLAQARRRTLIVVLSLLTAYLVLLPMLLQVLPGDGTKDFAGLLAVFDNALVVAGLALLMVLASAGMLTVATVSFQRHRLNVN